MRGLLPTVCASALLLLAPAAPPRAAADPLIVMTYNIGGVCAEADIPMPPAVIRQIAREIKDARADLVGIQESVNGSPHRGGRNITGEIVAALREEGWPMECRTAPYKRYASGVSENVILSRFPIREDGWEPTGGRDDAAPCVQYVRVEPEPGKRVTFFNTHYMFGFERICGNLSMQEVQSLAVVRFMRRFGGHHILTGDFNSRRASGAHRILEASGLADATAQEPPGACNTVGEGAGKVAPRRLSQIDFVFVGPTVTPRGARVPSSTMSDHWPVVARLELTGAPPADPPRTSNLLANPDFSTGLEGWSSSGDGARALPGRGPLLGGDIAVGVESDGAAEFCLWQTVRVAPGATYEVGAWGVAANAKTVQRGGGTLEVGVAQGAVSDPHDPRVAWGDAQHAYPWVPVEREPARVTAEGGKLTIVLRGRLTAPREREAVLFDRAEVRGPAPADR